MIYKDRPNSEIALFYSHPYKVFYEALSLLHCQSKISIWACAAFTAAGLKEKYQPPVVSYLQIRQCFFS